MRGGTLQAVREKQTRALAAQSTVPNDQKELLSRCAWDRVAPSQRPAAPDHLVPVYPVPFTFHRTGEEHTIEEEVVLQLGERSSDAEIQALVASVVREVGITPTSDMVQRIKASLGAWGSMFTEVAALGGRELLVPIKIDVEDAGQRYQDELLWDIVSPVNSPDDYCAALTEGPSAIPAPLAKKVLQQMRAQILARKKAAKQEGRKPDAGT
ncbi:unnamed protein product [Pedinophyceae sp. YPF-701]|nr:unnamed protein product [Pedinophyceae sp. YPF-701]